MGASLWEINEQIEELAENLIDMDTGELDENVMGQLSQLQMDKKEKTEAIILKVKSLQAEAEAIMTERKNLKKRADSKVSRANWLMEYVLRNMDEDDFETTKVRAYKKQTEAVEVVNEEAIPDDWCRFRTERKPDKVGIKKALKGGEKIPGVCLKDNVNLVIK